MTKASRSRASKREYPGVPPHLQRRAGELLKKAEIGGKFLDDISQLVLSLELVRGYEILDQGRSVNILESSLASVRKIAEQNDDTQLKAKLLNYLQIRIVKELASIAPARLDKQLDGLPLTAREAAISSLIPLYIKSHQLLRAKELLLYSANEREMPYEVASKLMRLLARGRPDELRSIFISSLSSFQNHDHFQFQTSGDFPSMIVEFASHLPEELVRESVDEVLSQAKKFDEKLSAVSMNIELASPTGVARFRSAFDFRLFQLADVLRRVDPTLFDELMRERLDVRTQSERYPRGLSSLQPKSASDSPLSLTVGAGEIEPPGPSMLEYERASKISSTAKEHPFEAVANAESLSPSLAIDTLVDIAYEVLESNPSASETATAKARQLAQEMPPSEQAVPLQEITAIYIRLAEKKRARDCLTEALAVATVIYERDVDPDDPDKAPKAYWPSTNAYRAVIANAQRIDARLPALLLDQIPDDGIRALSEATIASGMLGLKASEFHIVSQFKKEGIDTVYQERE
jgi:hypothetical protein